MLRSVHVAQRNTVITGLCQIIGCSGVLSACTEKQGVLAVTGLMAAGSCAQTLNLTL